MSSGNCDECRKKKYCSKQCKARRIYIQKKIAQAAIRVIIGK